MKKLTLSRFDYATYLAFFVYAAASMAIPIVLVQLAPDLGFPLNDDGGKFAGGGLHLARSVAICVTLALSAFISARFGNRRPLGFAVLLVGVGMLACALTPSYWFLILALTISGFGEGIAEALATPFVQDLHDDEPSRYVNFSHGFWSLGVFVSALGFGALLFYGVHWRVILGVVMLLSIPSTLLFLVPSRDKAYTEKKRNVVFRDVLRQAREVCAVPRFWYYFAAMFLAGGGEFCLTFWCASFIQLNFAGSAMAGGVGTAIFALGMFVGRAGAGILVKHKHLKRLVVWAGLAATAVALPVPYLTCFVATDAHWVLPVFYALLFLVGLGTAPFWPSIQSYAVDQMPRQDSTMIFILLSCAGIPGCGICTLLMGYIGDRWSLPVSFYLVPACFIILTVLILADRGKNACRPAADAPPTPTSNR